MKSPPALGISVCLADPSAAERACADAHERGFGLLFTPTASPAGTAATSASASRIPLDPSVNAIGTVADRDRALLTVIGPDQTIPRGGPQVRCWIRETFYDAGVASASGSEKGSGGGAPSWTFLTNHGHVLVCIARDGDIRGRDLAALVGITERAAQAIVADLVAAGYVRRERVGRRNRYTINAELPVRHPVEQPHSIGELLHAVAAQVDQAPGAGQGAGRRRARPAR